MKRTIGIFGTAKNTGKTTATIALINHFVAKGLPLGLTSIGYDGETLDNVTGLPKPRIFAPKGIRVITAERCLEAGSAKIAVKEKMDIVTPLGRLVCGVIEREGLLVTAGPNQQAHLRTVKEWLYENGAVLTIVDGALNRISPMAETDGLILATGGAFRPDIGEIASHGRWLEIICNYPEQETELLGSKILESNKTILWDSKGEILAETGSFLLDPNQLNPFSAFCAQAAGFYCPGVITPQCLIKLSEMPFAPGVKHIFADPTKIIIGNGLAAAHEYIRETIARGNTVSYIRKLPLIAVTVNPFYPKFRYEANKYEPAYVNKDQLLKQVSDLLEVPVFDVVAQGSDLLAEALLD